MCAVISHFRHFAVLQSEVIYLLYLYSCFTVIVLSQRYYSCEIAIALLLLYGCNIVSVLCYYCFCAIVPRHSYSLIALYMVIALLLL